MRKIWRILTGTTVLSAAILVSGTQQPAAAGVGFRTYHSGATGALAIKATPSSNGFYLLTSTGTVAAYGDAPQLGAATLPHKTVTMAPTLSGKGYWVFDDNGCVQTFGDAQSFTGANICQTKLNGPVLDAAVTPSGNGYWLVASDGGMFAFGDAPFRGSMGGSKLNANVVGMAAARDGSGYWETAGDGGIFAFGEPFLGSMGDKSLNKPVVGMVANGAGYMMVASDGGIFNFSNPFFGSLGATAIPAPIIATAPSYDNLGNPDGYWMLDSAGLVYAFGNAYLPAEPITKTGTLVVGVDIQPGTYKTNPGTAGCYWEAVSGFGGTISEIIVNDFGSGQRVFNVYAADKGVNVSNCGPLIDAGATYAFNSTAQHPAAGVFIVGRDIAPGTWQSSGGASCYWARLRSFDSDLAAIIANDYGASSTVTISSGDVGFEVSGCGPWSKIG